MITCLNENETAQYVDYLCLRINPPPERILDHVAGCHECKRDILEIYEICIIQFSC